jgi:hypothetical protein
MSIRWILVAAAALVLIDCGSGESPDECEEGYAKKDVCTQCGLAGGCAKTETKCALKCADSAACARPLGCWDGVCQLTECE